jgi:hypothetical protein
MINVRDDVAERLDALFSTSWFNQWLLITGIDGLFLRDR